jgi:hypothetical protein
MRRSKAYWSSYQGPIRYVPLEVRRDLSIGNRRPAPDSGLGGLGTASATDRGPAAVSPQGHCPQRHYGIGGVVGA